MRISDWSSDVCSSDLDKFLDEYAIVAEACQAFALHAFKTLANVLLAPGETHSLTAAAGRRLHHHRIAYVGCDADCMSGVFNFPNEAGDDRDRSEEHTSELQSLMRISYAVFCLKNKKS